MHNDDGNPLVDDLFYYANNHDVWNAHIDADAHYNSIGWHEGRNPNAFFNTGIYLSANPGVRSFGVNPLTQFDTVGWKGGLIPSINFDPLKYLAANPDVAAAHVDPLAHFLQNGGDEGRQPFMPDVLPAANGFDYVYYLQHNPDVVAAGVDPFWHFEVAGWKEGRNPNAFFDTAGYLATYPDVAAAGINPLDHYHQFGWQEGRSPSPLFDTALYLQHNPDVAAAHIDPLEHYLQYGMREGRVAFASPVVDKDGAVNAVVEGAANGTHIGLTVAWGAWVSPSLTYSMSADSSGGGFTVDPTTGVVTVADGTRIDFENAPGHAYTITVAAHDNGQTVTQTFTINVADAAATIPTGNQPVASVDENAPGGTTFGLSFTLTDPNGAPTAYDLTDDAGGRFTINSVTGEISVANGAAIDFETTPLHSYTIIAHGTAGATSASETFKIGINDLNETPAITSSATMSVDENAAAGAAVGTVVAIDPDTTAPNKTLTYTATGGTGAALFDIDPATGAVTVKNGAVLNFEVTPSYTLDVQATDGGGLSATQTITIGTQRPQRGAGNRQFGHHDGGQEFCGRHDGRHRGCDRPGHHRAEQRADLYGDRRHRRRAVRR